MRLHALWCKPRLVPIMSALLPLDFKLIAFGSHYRTHVRNGEAKVRKDFQMNGISILGVLESSGYVKIWSAGSVCPTPESHS